MTSNTDEVAALFPIIRLKSEPNLPGFLRGNAKEAVNVFVQG
ncbi:hypothetical protein [Halarchaeum salinum]